MIWDVIITMMVTTVTIMTVMMMMISAHGQGPEVFLLRQKWLSFLVAKGKREMQPHNPLSLTKNQSHRGHCCLCCSMRVSGAWDGEPQAWGAGQTRGLGCPSGRAPTGCRDGERRWVSGCLAPGWTSSRGDSGPGQAGARRSFPRDAAGSSCTSIS